MRPTYGSPRSGRVTPRFGPTTLVLLSLVAIACNDGSGPTRDTTAPTVQSTSPANGVGGAARATPITVTFSEEIDASTVTGATFTVTGLTGTVTAGGSTAIFTFAGQLTAGATYTATITTGVADVAGNHLAADHLWTFTANSTPTASAGDDRDVNTDETVQLSATATDPDGQALSYNWTQLSGPSVGALSGQNPSFTAPGGVSTIELQLVVSDGVEDAPPARVVMRVLEDKAKALWVSAAGSDSNPGTRAAPKRRIQAAIEVAKTTGADVYVAGGIYAETITLRDSVSLYGGFSGTNWLRDVAANVTTIQGGPTAITGVGADSLTIAGFTIRAADGVTPSQSSVGVAFDNSVGVSLIGNTIIAGNGAVGRDGVAPARGINGANGAAGSWEGSGGAGGPTGGFRGGNGGNGGLQTVPGAPGSHGQGPLGGAGGPGGGYLGSGGPGADGGAGTDGAVHGASGQSLGQVGSGVYVPANGGSGANGEGGSGGGGGGASGCGSPCDWYAGGGGGGGGAGGQGGPGGPGGGGGGASIGVLISKGSTVTLAANAITTGAGGNGGMGAVGAAGGAGGAGSAGGRPGFASGGSGANGGRGGHGRDGGGGGGGPTIGIVEDGSSSSNLSVGLGSNAVTLGTPGLGGRHANASQSDGARGQSTAYKQL